MGWLVYRLTHSAALLGVVGFVSNVPTFFIAPFGGVMADRWIRRRMVLTTQTLSMLQALALLVLVISGSISVAWIIALSLFLGLLNAFDVPARQSFLVEMVGKREDLGSAIALNSSIFNVARLIGPSIAGVLIVLGGEALCFGVNAVSYLAVIAAILAMKIPAGQSKPTATNVFQGLKDGFSYVYRSVPIRTILTLLAMTSLLGMPFTVLLPVFAKEILHGGPQTFGFLVGITGMGALSAALALALRKYMRGLLKRIAFAAMVFGAGLILFSQSKGFVISAFCLYVTGFGMMFQTIASNMILQTLVEDDKRGRVMSFFTVSLMGTAPFGNLAAGLLAGQIGAPATVFLGGVACIAAAVLFMTRLEGIRPLVRAVYVEKGVIPSIPD